MVNTVRVNADHGRDFHPLADHMTKLQNFTKAAICEFLAFPFSLQLMFDETLTNVMIFLMIAQKLHTTVAQGISMLQWTLSMFDFSQMNLK